MISMSLAVKEAMMQAKEKQQENQLQQEGNGTGVRFKVVSLLGGEGVPQPGFVVEAQTIPWLV